MELARCLQRCRQGGDKKVWRGASLGWEVEEGVCPHAPITITNPPTRGTQTHSRKVKTAEAVIGNQDQRKRNQAGRRMICPNHRKLPSAKKCIKDPIELHNIKQRDGESTEDFVRRYKLESKDVKGAPKCMRTSEFVHGITNPELIKRLHDKITKTVDKMIRVTTSFLRGEVAASNHERKNSFPPWKQQESGHRQNFKKGGFMNPAESGKKARSIPASPHKNTPRNFRLEKEIQDCHHHNDNPEANRRDDQGRKLSHLIKEIKKNMVEPIGRFRLCPSPEVSFLSALGCSLPNVLFDLFDVGCTSLPLRKDVHDLRSSMHSEVPLNILAFQLVSSHKIFRGFSIPLFDVVEHYGIFDAFFLLKVVF
ncbi:hypothetical protein Tco_1386279 [Tanacetum coccineum]